MLKINWWEEYQKSTILFWMSLKVRNYKNWNYKVWIYKFQNYNVQNYNVQNYKVKNYGVWNYEVRNHKVWNYKVQNDVDWNYFYTEIIQKDDFGLLYVILNFVLSNLVTFSFEPSASNHVLFYGNKIKYLGVQVINLWVQILFLQNSKKNLPHFDLCWVKSCKTFRRVAQSSKWS